MRSNPPPPQALTLLAPSDVKLTVFCCVFPSSSQQLPSPEDSCGVFSKSKMSSSKSPIKFAWGIEDNVTRSVLKTVSQSNVEIPAMLKKKSWFVCPVPSPHLCPSIILKYLRLAVNSINQPHPPE
ncbi:unnamed protein product [Lota lota]